MTPPEKHDEQDVRTRAGGKRLILGGIAAALVIVAVMALLAGEPNPQQGESLPNAPPQRSEAVK